MSVETIAGEIGKWKTEEMTFTETVYYSLSTMNKSN